MSTNLDFLHCIKIVNALLSIPFTISNHINGSTCSHACTSFNLVIHPPIKRSESISWSCLQHQTLFCQFVLVCVRGNEGGPQPFYIIGAKQLLMTLGEKKGWKRKRIILFIMAILFSWQLIFNTSGHYRFLAAHAAL